MIEEIILKFIQANFPKLNPRRDGHIVHINRGNIYNYSPEGFIKIRADFNRYLPIDIYYDNPKFFDMICEALVCQYNKNEYDKSHTGHYSKTTRSGLAGLTHQVVSDA